MTDLEMSSLNIKPLEYHSDYHLCKVGLEGACVEKNYEEAMEQFPAEMADTKYKKNQTLPSSVMIPALSDTALRIFQVVKGYPVQMLNKLYMRYASKIFVSKIIKMTSLITMKYTSLRYEIVKT